MPRSAIKQVVLCALLCAATTGVLTACASGEKTTTTKVENPDGTVTTTTVTTKGDGSMTTLSGTGTSADSRREVEPNPPVDANNTTVIMGGDADTANGEIDAHTDENGNSRVHVNMPGVHINADDSSAKVNIDVPFVHIHKDGSGNTRIKAPFVRINSREE
ncbi:MAG: hypothetical protein JSS83_26095 [Cyanobacteria bacterium SZAS LIN-3]|nr:hypothetical protein [Cyanobacteria bacterium SZAS LIN-3]